MADGDFRSYAKEILTTRFSKTAPAKLDFFLSRVFYVSGFFDDSESYIRLGKRLSELDAQFSTCSNKLYHLAVPPTSYEVILNGISSSGLSVPCGGISVWARVLIEKPF